ncbi:MAG TPA: cell division protein ZapB [Bacteroidales bacterium]|nr:cell division protein ZapB [Bacteroidales bacterium]HPL05271.1 cell division protein ZapB [Bacteroidales bacterium]
MELPNDINELKQLVYTLIDEIVSLKTEVATLKSQVASLEKENAVLRKENAELKQENILLKIEISELKARLNQNSSNSSKPPSSDYFNRKPAFSKTSVGKKGGQSGHKGDTLKQIENPDKIVEPRRAHASNVVRINVNVVTHSIAQSYLLLKNVRFLIYHNQN